MNTYIKMLIPKLQKIIDTEISGRNMIEQIKVLKTRIDTGKYADQKPIKKISETLDGICWDGAPGDFDDPGDDNTMCDEMASEIKKLKKLVK